ncbi:MAG: LytTR family DNA-binding domain-containing protein [Caulobacteraceae bacterium]
MALGLLRSVVIAAGAGQFLAYAGAFGTALAPLPQRLGYWITTMVLATLIGAAIFMPVYLKGWLKQRPLLGSVILALVMSAPLTVLVWFLGPQFFPDYMATDPKILPGFFPPVFLVSVIMTAINHLAADHAERRKAQITHAAPAGAAPPRFLERVPVKLRGGELYAVQAEDHYLRLHTSKGSDLILMRLADAIAELDGLEGAQTHRSWWVAKGAVTDARRSDGRGTLVLKNGVEAPVSRSYAGALRDAGWF